VSEVHRVLKPGGRAAFWDPMRYNTVINIYRKMASQVRTEDEHPLGIDDIDFVRRLFTKVSFRTFGLVTLGVFLKFYFIDLVHPNEERYWKKVVTDYPSFRSYFRVFSAIDNVLLRLPGVRWLAWNVALVGTK
jgi:SAM-dependent methyltransferase